VGWIEAIGPPPVVLCLETFWFFYGLEKSRRPRLRDFYLVFRGEKSWIFSRGRSSGCITLPGGGRCLDGGALLALGAELNRGAVRAFARFIFAAFRAGRFFRKSVDGTETARLDFFRFYFKVGGNSVLDPHKFLLRKI